MRTICLYFEIHKPYHLKRYRFFDIGTDHYYYDDYENEHSITDAAQRSYIPSLKTFLQMTKQYGDFFRVAFSISGVAIELLEQYAPEVIDLLQLLNETGCVEFLAEPYSHGLSSLGNDELFATEVSRQAQKIKEMFSKSPKVLRNSALIYNDDIGAVAAQLGFKGMMIEGAKHILGWKSPHYVYSCAKDARLSLLLRDYKLSDDIGLRFNDMSWSEYPLMADKYISWINGLKEEEHVINIMMNLDALGIYQPISSNILDFFMALPAEAQKQHIKFSTPSETIAENKPIAPIEVIYPVSWNDEERDTGSLLGNDMQREAFNKLYDEKIVGRIQACRDRRIKQDWDRLQASDNFRFMTTKNNGLYMSRRIYDSEYDAFINYMNILGDFLKRVKDLFSDDVENEELNSLYTQIANMGNELNVKENEIIRLKATLKKLEEDRKSNELASKRTEQKLKKRTSRKVSKSGSKSVSKK